MTTITEPRSPGLYEDLSNASYHAGMLTNPKPLSSSMAKTIVTKSPAEFRWEQDHRIERSAFDEGQAVHELVLEGGFKSIDVLDFDSFRTKDAKAARDASYAASRHPLLTADVAPLQNMAAAVAASPLAANVFTNGKPEVSALAYDREHGIYLQARMDWLQLPKWGSDRTVIADLKTSDKGANPRSFNREIAERRYHLSMAFYRRVLMLLGYDDPRLLFVVVGKREPYFISVHEVSVSDRIIGDQLVNKAIGTYADCLAADDWPGYDRQIHVTDLPAWAAYEAEEIAGPIYEGV
jgi:hypothetical protein